MALDSYLRNDEIISDSGLNDNVKVFSAIKLNYHIVNPLQCISMLCIKHGSFLSALRI